MLGITHLLNAAEGRRYGFVNTDSNYYRDTTIKYLGLAVMDLPSINISKYFDVAANFIDEAISMEGNLNIYIFTFVYLIVNNLIQKLKKFFFR